MKQRGFYLQSVRCWICCLTLLLAQLPAAASAGSYQDPPQLFFSICPPSEACYTQLDRAKSIGVDGVIANVQGPLASLEGYAAHAQALGLQVWWMVSDPGWWRSADMPAGYPYFAAACGAGCTTKDELRQSIISWLAALPATGGYYIADDTGIVPGEEAGVAAHYQAVKAADPQHLTLMGTMGYADFDGGRVAPWMFSADAIGQELYPIYDGETSPPGWPAISDPEGWAGAIAAGNQATADRLGAPSLAFILQAFSWGWHPYDARSQRLCQESDSELQCQQRYHYPNAEQQRSLLDGVLYHSRPRLISWWLLEDTVGWPAGTVWPGILEPTEAQVTERTANLTALLHRPRRTPRARLSATGTTLSAAGSLGLGGITAYRWQVDGVAQGETGPQLRLPVTARSRVVRLEITDAAGQQDAAELTLARGRHGDPSRGPVARIRRCARRRQGRVCLSALGSTGRELRYAWDTNGDGTIDARSALVDVVPVRHRRVRLRVVDAQGRRASTWWPR